MKRKSVKKPIDYRARAVKEMRNSVHEITNPQHHEYWFGTLGSKETYELFRRVNAVARASKKRLLAGSATKTIDSVFGIAKPEHSPKVKKDVENILKNAKAEIYFYMGIAKYLKEHPAYFNSGEQYNALIRSYT